MNKRLLVTIYHFFIPDLNGIPSRAYSDEFYRRRQQIHQLGFYLLGEVGTFVHSSSTRRQLHGKGKTGREAAVLTWLLAGNNFYNLRTCNWHNRPPSLVISLLLTDY